MSNLPPKTDHAFMRMIRARCEDKRLSMAEIAAEVGCTADELCRWVMDYKAPAKRQARDNSKYGPPITYDGRPIRSMDDYQREAERFKAWKRQHEGAKAATAQIAAMNG